MDAFKAKITKTTNDIRTLSGQTSALNTKLIHKSSSVLDNNEETQLNREINAIEQLFKETSAKIKQDLKEMKETTDNINNYKETFMSETILSHWQALTTKFRRECDNFRKAQVKHHDIEKNKAITQARIENPDLNDSDLEKIQSEIVGKAKERNNRVRQIAQSIGDLCNLIDELHEMVKNQRGMVDRIEVQTSASVTATEKAKVSLKNAYNYQMSATRIKRIIIAIVVLVVLGFAVYFGFKAFKAVKPGYQPISANQQM